MKKALLVSVLAITFVPGVLKPGALAANEDTFLKILKASYQASCGNVDRLRDFYLPEAEIIHDGRQATLNETIEEITQSIGSLKDLVCVYKPRVQGSYIGDEISFMTLRESILFSAEEVNNVEIRQICTYIFLKKNEKWMITHDHCSKVEGQSV